jgi:hypothetical protein
MALIHLVKKTLILKKICNHWGRDSLQFELTNWLERRVMIMFNRKYWPFGLKHKRWYCMDIEKGNDNELNLLKMVSIKVKLCTLQTSKFI